MCAGRDKALMIRVGTLRAVFMFSLVLPLLLAVPYRERRKYIRMYVEDSEIVVIKKEDQSFLYVTTR